MSALVYLAFFAVTVAVCFLGVPLCSWLERRADARDRETWSRQPGARL